MVQKLDKKSPYCVQYLPSVLLAHEGKRRYSLAHCLTSSPLSLWYSATYKLLSMIPGMGLISVPSCSSIPLRLKRSSYVMRLMARPRCPKRPEDLRKGHLLHPDKNNNKNFQNDPGGFSPDLPMR